MTSVPDPIVTSLKAIVFWDEDEESYDSNGSRVKFSSAVSRVGASEEKIWCC